ncbi:MAG: tetratricopeptide repeat protein [Spirochaetes bacterium]|nr:tetratricopeptide repeat protein [Spirochaetota bacterium]
MMSQAVPKEVISIYNNALMLSNKGDFEQALSEYRRAITLYPQFLQAYNNIGEIYSRMGKSELAISHYRKALEIAKNNRVLLNLGVEYYNRREYQVALQYFLESLALDSDFLEGNFYTAMAYFNLKNYSSAEHYLKKVISIERKHEKSHYLLAYIYYEWKQYERAIAVLDAVKDIASDKAFYYKYYGFCCYHLGRYEEAVSYLTIALESNPNYAKYKKYLKGLTYEKKLKELGDIDARIREMEQRLIGNNASIREYTRLSMLYIFKGEYRKAEELLLKVTH